MKISDLLKAGLSRIVLLLFLAGCLSSAFGQTAPGPSIPKTASEPSAKSALAGNAAGNSVPAGKALVLMGPFELNPSEMKALGKPEHIDAMLSMARSAWDRTARTQEEGERIPQPLEESLVQLIVSKMRSAFPSLNIVRMKSEEWQSIAADPERKPFSGSKNDADFIAIVFYAFEEGEIDFIIGTAAGSGELAIYKSGRQSIFAMSDAVQKAVDVLGSPMGLAPLAALKTAPKLQISQNEMAEALSRLPASDLWPDRERFKNASAHFKTMFGASILSLCATILSAGSWQTYQEAMVRNPAFQTGALISGIAAGGTAAVTIAFLAAAVWNAVIMLQTAQ